MRPVRRFERQGSRKHDFRDRERALTAYATACAVVERSFGMDPERVVTIQGTVVSVPGWFPYDPVVPVAGYEVRVR